MSVERQEHTECQEGCSFVAIDKRVIFSEAHAVCSSQISDVRIVVKCQIQGPGKRRIQLTLVPQPRRAAMLRQAFLMQKQQNLPVHPSPPAHLAN